jgi:hypothetical protein
LRSAIRAGSDEDIRALMAVSYVHLPNSFNELPIDEAARLGRVGALKLLALLLDSREIQDYSFALGVAAAVGGSGCVSALRGGARFGPKALGGALCKAAAARQDDCVDLLIPGAYLESKSREGWTPLFEAARRGTARSVAALLGAGASASARDRRGDTPLIASARMGNAPATAALLSHSAPEARNDLGETALHAAASHSDPGSAIALLSVCDPGARNGAGLTPLAVAASKGRGRTAAALLAASDLGATDRAGRTPAQLARDGGHEEAASTIDAYALAQAERAALGRHVLPRKRASSGARL